MKFYTIKDIARKAGVSVTTVSRVLNKRPDVKPETREKVERVMSECHFVGNANARGLKQPDTEIIAIILRGRDNPFLNALAESMLEHAHESSASFVMEYLDEEDDEFQAALRLYHEKRVKGFIFVGGRIDERADVLRGLDTPMVFTTINAEKAAFPRAASVFIDDRAMGSQAMNTLLDAGHRRIAIFGGIRQGDDGFAKRYQGAMDALHEADVPFEEERFVQTRFTLKGAYETARRFFEAHGDTSAVFAMSDTVAMGVIRALQDMGKHVPEDVSVVGFDGIEMGKYFIPRLTTVAQPVGDIARESVQVLMDMLDNDAPPRHIVVEGTLQIRESVK